VWLLTLRLRIDIDMALSAPVVYRRGAASDVV
jgi:hypothetical protein